jgi:fibronectin-binding autotransporter adhesin
VLNGVKLSANTFAVAQALDQAVAQGADVSPYFAIYNQPDTGTLVAALSSLSGELHAENVVAGQMIGAGFLNTMLVQSGEPSGQREARALVWSAISHKTLTLKESAGQNRHIHINEVAAGLQKDLGDTTALGVAVALGEGAARLDRLGHSDLRSLQVGAYAKQRIGQLQLNVSTAYGVVRTETTRAISTLGQSMIRADYDIQLFSARLEGAYALPPIWGVTSYVLGAVQHVQADTPAFQETNTGNAAGVAARSAHNVDQHVEVGLSVKSAPKVVQGFGSVRYATYHRRKAGITMSLAGVPTATFLANSARQADDAAVFNAGLRWAITPSITATLAGDGEVSKQSTRAAVSFGLRLQF